MAGTDLETRTRNVVETIDSSDFRDRVEPLLPDTVPFRRFAQLAKTAVRSTPDLAEADPRSLFNAIIRCAEAGLYPNNEDAALVPYKGKVTFIPMVDGVRKIAAEYGWMIRARVVFENDDFDYTEEPPALRHRPVRPGMDRGDRIAAYAVATHRDGRRLQRVLHPDEIQKRRAKAQTTRVWDEFPDAMWAKSAVHALFGELPRAERDLMPRLDAVDDVDPAQAVDLLYGPEGSTFTAIPAPPSDAAGASNPLPEAAGTSGNDRQQAEPAPPLAGSAPGDDEDPEPKPTTTAQVDHGATVVPKGAYQGMTLAAVADLGDDGEKWLTWAARNKTRFDQDFATALLAFIDDQLRAAA